MEYWINDFPKPTQKDYEDLDKKLNELLIHSKKIGLEIDYVEQQDLTVEAYVSLPQKPIGKKKLVV